MAYAGAEAAATTAWAVARPEQSLVRFQATLAEGKAAEMAEEAKVADLAVVSAAARAADLAAATRAAAPESESPAQNSTH